MASLTNLLESILRSVLPERPEDAVNGTELKKRVSRRLGGQYKGTTLTQTFSRMAADSSSVIAKVANKHGYYLRTVPPTRALDSAEEATNAATRATALDEEKFRALFIRCAELENRFAMRVDDALAERANAAVNKWKFPDVVLLDWDVGKVEECRLDRNLLDVKRSLGEQPFRLTSVALKVTLTFAGLREDFFQCVSNSKWAHHSLLAVACPIDDTALVEELRRLATSYDVTIVSYSLDATSLQCVPPAEKITTMSDEDFDEVAKSIKVATIATGRPRTSLDWEHIKDMRDRGSDFILLFDWVAHCLKEGRAVSCADFQKVAE